MTDIIGRTDDGALLFGDLKITSQPSSAKLIKAMAVIAHYLHPVCDQAGWMAPGKSRESCILSSMIAREFLFRIGFRDADVRSVVLFMRAFTPEGEEAHSLGIGDPRLKPGDPSTIPVNGRLKWNGHAVVTVDGWMIDTTIYQATPRAAWPGLPPMIAARLNPDVATDRVWDLPLLAGVKGKADNGNDVIMGWLSQSFNDGWRSSPDAMRKHERQKIVRQLVEAFGTWRDEDAVQSA